MLNGLIDALKANANELFALKQYAAAVQEYSDILDCFGQGSPQDYIKVILCNRAACFIELGTFDGPSCDG